MNIDATIEYATPLHATNGSTAGNGVLCGSVERLYLENRNTAYSVESGIYLELGERQSKTVVLGGGVGG
jgi:hypothetical protein